MAIDRDPKSYWLSEPNGAVPKDLAVDMKDLKTVSRVRISAPDPNNQCPVRGELFGSNDGHFWFKLASNPPAAPQPQIVGEFGKMTRRIYAGNATGFTTWQQVVDHERFFPPGETDTDLPIDGELFLPGLGCGLWIAGG